MQKEGQKNKTIFIEQLGASWCFRIEEWKWIFEAKYSQFVKLNFEAPRKRIEIEKIASLVQKEFY